MPEEEKTPEQIPWAQHVKVTYDSGSSVEMKSGEVLSADIYHKDFEWSVTMNSKIAIDDYMKLDERLTKDIQDHFEEFVERQDKPSTFRSRIESWLKHGPVSIALPQEGPKEWRPASKGRRKRTKPWKFGQYGYANTYNEDNSYYWGDVFEFAHFTTDDGDDGVVIMWQGGGDPCGNYHMPQVYLGDFEAFFDSQYEHDPHSVEAFLNWNSAFENGFMWAWHRMDVFLDWDDHVSRMDDRHVVQVLRAIEKDPSILLPESVQQILENDPETYPKQIQKAVTWLMENKRRELEKALGQRLLWEDVYGE